MSFNWSKFFDVGLCMKNISDREEYQRSAVGRYYYAAYGLAKKYYENKYDDFVPGIDGHYYLINKLKESTIKEEKELGKNLDRLRKIRNHADYRSLFYLSNVSKGEKHYKKIIKYLKILENKK